MRKHSSRKLTLALGAVLLFVTAFAVGSGIARGTGAAALMASGGASGGAEAPGAVMVPSSSRAPDAPPAVAAVPRKPAAPSAAKKPGKERPSSSLLAQQGKNGPDLAPPVMLTPPRDGPAGAPVITEPSRPLLPPAPPRMDPGPPVIAGAPPAAPAPAAPVLAAPRNPDPGDGPNVLENGFTERPSQNELPEIDIENTTGMPAILTLVKGETRLRWNIDRHINKVIEPGQYTFKLYHAIYRRTGRPDMVGTLTCRRYKAYDCEIYWRSGSDTLVGKVGDKD